MGNIKQARSTGEGYKLIFKNTDNVESQFFSIKIIAIFDNERLPVLQ